MTTVEDKWCDERDAACQGNERACDICNIIFCNFHGEFEWYYKTPAPEESPYGSIYYPVDCKEAKDLPKDTPKVELCAGCIEGLEEIV